jgi:hypothetical protein
VTGVQTCALPIFIFMNQKTRDALGLTGFSDILDLRYTE